MKKKSIAFALAIAFVSALFATDQDECFQLNEYFNKSPDATHEKISEYERRLSEHPGDHYAHLAIAILNSALSSPMEKPEKGASEKIVEHSEQFERIEKDNPLAMTYYGLGCSLVSRDSGNPFKKMKMVKKGISIFDKAASLSENRPIEWFVRYMRANFYINLPTSFNKRDVAISDFEYIRDLYAGQKDIEGYMCNAYYNLGEIEKTRGNLDAAIRHWEASVEINARLNLNACEGEKAKEELELFGE